MAPPKYARMCGRRLSQLIALLTILGFLLFGYDQGVMANLLIEPVFISLYTANNEDPLLRGTLTSIYEFGGLLGALVTLILLDLIGRRKTIMFGSLCMIIGVLIQITAMREYKPLVQFMVGRCVTGFGNGVNLSSMPSYQSECCKRHRAWLLMCMQGGITAFGTTMAYWMTFGAHFGPPELVWRLPIGFQMVFCVLIIVTMFYLPDSPHYLISKNKIAEGERVLAALEGKDIDDPATKHQKNLVIDSIRTSRASKERFKDLFTSGRTQHRRRMMMGTSSKVFKELTGCNAVIYFLPFFLKRSLDRSVEFAMLIGGISMTLYALCATFSWFFVGKLGRRKLFILGSLGQFLAMIIIFACVAARRSGSTPGAIFGFFLYLGVFGASWLSLPWLYAAEITPDKAKAQANSLTACNSWLFNFSVVTATPVMVSNIGWVTYLLFGLMNALIAPLVWYLYPETSNRSKQEIDLIFAKGYVEKMSYVTAAKELPKLTDEEVERKATAYRLMDDQNNGKVEAQISSHGAGSAQS
ncbi:monosaccharide transporter [Histoplasma capsulatum var. duboisii H88]|uniref:Monosaccharide transporter n=3 Tax=Ajellomyces capsulatus TaxID=5037 RepID=F0UBS3_AJEC8|nr:monosaccharide transporter [Histoplasma capsulatum H143]EGC43922.1 monosaccharide transporter [Histoplasma capsulatum var. duboisii H88]